MPAAAPPALEPRLLRALDNTHPTDNGWTAECPHFGCGATLHITHDTHEWRLHCEQGCTHQELVDYLQADTRLDPITSNRAWRALCLSPTPTVWQALLENQAVPIAALDPLWARRFRIR